MSESIETYFQSKIEGTELCNVALDENGLLSNSKKAILDGLMRLDALPRCDPFWNNTNDRATIYKLDEFCRELLGQNHDDARAAWTLIGLDLLHWRDLDVAHWKPLAQQGQLKSSLLIEAGLWFHTHSGTSASEFAAFLRDLGLCFHVREELMLISRGGDEVLDYGRNE